MKYNIAFYCQSIPFTDKTCRLEHSLGGSETMLIGLTRALSRQGHRVQVFTKFESLEHEGTYEGVEYFDHSHFAQLLPSVEWDIFISLRCAEAMTLPVKAGGRFLWNQDELSYPTRYLGHLWQTDRLIMVSEWQKRHYTGLLPEVSDLCWVTRNGIDLGLINRVVAGAGEKDPNKLIYISRPERGLDPLLEIFPKIRARRPDVHLKVARYYSMYEPLPNIKAICDRADRLVSETEGIEFLGNLSKANLYREIATSRLMVYPGVPNFNETSCIAAIEAQACGTPIICSNRGALTETIADGAGIKVDGDAYSEEYQEHFVAHVLNLLADDEAYRDMQSVGRYWAKRYDYDPIAEEWGEMFDQFFESRYAQRKERIFDNLIHHDDRIAARHLAQREGWTAEAESVEADIQDATVREAHYRSEYAVHATDPTGELKHSGRLREVVATVGEFFERDAEMRILDFACGNGSFAVGLALAFPNATVFGMDYSPDLVKTATGFAKGQNVSDRVTFEVGDVASLDDRVSEWFDVVFCGEFIEHCADYAAVIDALERRLKPSGLIVFTMPIGPCAEWAAWGQKKGDTKGHVAHWTWGDMEDVFGRKRDYTARAMSFGSTVRGTPSGHWIVSYRRDKKRKTGMMNLDKKILVTRPFEKLSVCMIGKDVHQWADLCLSRVRDIADEIIIASNADDNDLSLADFERWGAEVIRCPRLAPHVPEDTPSPGDFAWLRNQGLAHATGDWVLWLDFDELLTYPNHLRKYLSGVVYDGYAIRQQHLAVDQEKHHDTPIRIFRNGRGIQFYGCIHEHAEAAMDKPIHPSLEIPECDLAHIGYIDERARRFKCLHRNFGMLAIDSEFYPGRKLTPVLFARDCLNFAHWEQVRAKGGVTAEAAGHLRKVVRIYQEGDWYNDPSHLYFKLIFGFYQRALAGLNIGLEVPIAGETLRFLSPKEFAGYSKAMIDAKAKELIRDLPQFREDDDGERGVLQYEL